jgi:transposase-like protein
MSQESDGSRHAIRYSQAFKMQVVRELEDEGLSFSAMKRKYGASAATVQRWTLKYGNGTRGKVVRVQRPEERNQLEELKKRVRLLESALADAHVDLSLERAYTRLACQRAGIADVEEFKKKADGKPPIKR